MYYLDYSAGRLTSAQIKSAGYTGVIRYVDAPGFATGKHITVNEYHELINGGVAVLLVFEDGSDDASGGWSAGVAYAKRAQQFTTAVGYNGPVFFACDETVVPSQWTEYLDGAASVFGVDRVGAYGFPVAIARARNHATFFWQCGARGALAPYADIWQDNNTQVTVAGLQCDRNLIIDPWMPLPASSNTPQLSTLEEQQMEMPAGDHVRKRLFAAGRPHYLWWEVADGHHVTVHQVVYVKRTNGSLPEYGSGPGYPVITQIDADRPGPIQFADDVAFVSVQYSCDVESTAAIG